MKKTLFFMSLLLGLMVSSFALTACGNDDDDDNTSSNPLVGVWKRSSTNYWEEYAFHSDYSFRYRDKEGSMPLYTDYGTYIIDGNKVTLIWNSDGEFIYCTFTVSGNTLKLVFYEDDGSIDGEAVYIKQ